MVFDVRFLPNPYYLESLRALPGNSPEVREFVLRCQHLLAKLADSLHGDRHELTRSEESLTFSAKVRYGTFLKGKGKITDENQKLAPRAPCSKWY